MIYSTDIEEHQALKKGRQVHRLLEHLPGQPDPEGVATRLLAHGPDRAEAGDLAEIFNQAMRVVTVHADVFAEGTLAEVDVSAYLPDLGRAMSGTIDRLVITPETVQVIDFKTNALVPDRPEDTPEGLLQQMGAYLVAIESIYPDREVEVSILWTEACTRMVLPHAIVRAALQNSTIS